MSINIFTMTVTIEYLVKKPSNVLWWDDYLEQSSDPIEQNLAKLLPEFRQRFCSGNDLVKYETDIIDADTRTVRFISSGATLENAVELYVWQLHRYEQLRPLIQYRTGYQKNYQSVTGPTLKLQN
jgi:hypothetical protein